MFLLFIYLFLNFPNNQTSRSTVCNLFIKFLGKQTEFQRESKKQESESKQVPASCLEEWRAQLACRKCKTSSDSPPLVNMAPMAATLLHHELFAAQTFFTITIIIIIIKNSFFGSSLCTFILGLVLLLPH